jgi:very-short-patch-repair endonuclease
MRSVGFFRIPRYRTSDTLGRAQGEPEPDACPPAGYPQAATRSGASQPPPSTLDGVPRAPRRPYPLAGKIFLGRAAVERGLLTRADLRSSAWQPVLRGIYADARRSVTHADRCAAVARYVLPPSGAIAGRSAVSLYGSPLGAAPNDPVEVVVPPSAMIGRRAGLRVHVVDLLDTDVTVRGGLRVTTGTRTCWDLAQWLAPVEAVVLVDALAAARLVGVPELIAYAEQRAGSRGWRRLMRVATLADAGAESPPESKVRVRLVLAGLPKPVTQYVITHNHRFVARVDLAWPQQRVAVEYDGLWHGSTDQFHADRRRLNGLAAAGWVVLHVTAQRLRDDFDGFVTELRTALRAR